MTRGGWILAGAALCAGLAAPAAAQESDEDYRRIVTIMRACATIADVPARVACYDNNIAPPDGGAISSATLPPPQPAVRQAGRETLPAAGFGADLLPSEREARRTSQQQESEERVAATREEQPGIYVLTLADGAEWRFTDSANPSYEVPGVGDLIKLQRGALGSVLMSFDGQRAIRVKRIR